LRCHRQKNAALPTARSKVAPLKNICLYAKFFTKKQLAVVSSLMPIVVTDLMKKIGVVLIEPQSKLGSNAHAGI